MRKLILLALAMVLAIGAGATTRDDFKANPKLSANNYCAYPTSGFQKLTPAPAGYVPFYIDHYGRHGSRWLISSSQYNNPVKWLSQADSAGVLTARGKEVLKVLKDMAEASKDRLGELSDIGAEQHQGIARRMYQNFPEVFAGNAPVDARSTIVIRCILSMQNEMDMLRSLNPNLKITMDASQHDMYYMNYSDPVVKPLRKQAEQNTTPQLDKLKAELLNPKHIYKVLFTNQKWAKNNLPTEDFMLKMFDVISNMQSHHQFENIDMSDLFTLEDRVNVWTVNNAGWYIWSGETPLTKNRVDYMEANLLRNFILSADKALAMGQNGATMRFGHESVVLPLVCLMGLNGMDYHTEDLSTLQDRWQSYKVFPMACNIQWIFYRKPGSSDILMKVLLNEKEATLPAEVTTDCAPYYHWKDVKAYYEKKLAAQPVVQ